MYKTVLVPLDGSPLAAKALPHAIELARSGKGKVVLLRVIRPLEVFTKEEAVPAKLGLASSDDVSLRDYEARRAETEAYLETLRKQLASQSIDVEARISEGNPASEILRNANAWGADLIVLTPHGLGTAITLPPGGLFGSVCDGILRNADLPVLVVRP